MAEEPVAIVLYEGVSAFEALGALAALHAAGLPAELAGADALVKAREGARLVPQRLGFAALDAAPALVLPGGDISKALGDASLAKALRLRRGKFNLAAGDAIQLLAAAGLVTDRRIARLPGDAEIPGATAVHARLVADGRLLTSFAGDAIVDLVIHWIGHERGDALARDAAAALGREYRAFAFGQQAER